MFRQNKEQKLKQKIIKKLSKNRNYNNYRIDYLVNWAFNKLSNSEFVEIIENLKALLPLEYLNETIIKDVEQVEFLEKNLMVYGIIRDATKEFCFSDYFDNSGQLVSFYTNYLNTSAFRNNFIELEELYKKSLKRVNRINAIKTTGKVIGTIAISPLLILGAIAKASWDKTASSEKSPEIYYYCKLCGEKNKNPTLIVRGFCPQKIKLNRFLLGHAKPDYHELYEGSQKTEYICKYCGRKSKTIQSLVFNVCPVRYRQTEEQYKTSERACISMCEPML